MLVIRDVICDGDDVIIGDLIEVWDCGAPYGRYLIVDEFFEHDRRCISLLGQRGPVIRHGLAGEYTKFSHEIRLVSRVE